MCAGKLQSTVKSVITLTSIQLMFHGDKNRQLILYLELQVFFVIRLIAGPTANSLPAITDQDSLMACDLMDGRDAFLTLCRDKHLEFSSLRRSKWSSMCMLVELHSQSQDRFVYTCNECKHHVETRYHCTVCEVSPDIKAQKAN